MKKEYQPSLPVHQTNQREENPKKERERERGSAAGGVTWCIWFVRGSFRPKTNKWQKRNAMVAPANAPLPSPVKSTIKTCALSLPLFHHNERSETKRTKQNERCPSTAHTFSYTTHTQTHAHKTAALPSSPTSHSHQVSLYFFFVSLFLFSLLDVFFLLFEKCSFLGDNRQLPDEV